MPVSEVDPVLHALDEVISAVEESAEVNRQIVRRARELRRWRAAGQSYREIAAAEERPLLVELLRANHERLAKAGSIFRRAEARALREEGLTLDRIAALFGVTRPRIIALLRPPAEARPERPQGS